ncbi:MAG: LptF/LptG family permease, partial [Aestuariivirga sp.]
MKILAWMMIRMIAARFIAILLGISFFVLTLELLTYSKDILALRPGDMSILLEYVLARAPRVLSTFLPISMLLAMLMALTELSYRNEMTALWAAGLSPVRLVVQLLPLALIAGGLQFLLNDQAIP